MTELLMVPLAALRPDNAINTRVLSRQADVDALAANIEKVGLLLPLSVRRENGHYNIIDGHRRFAALLKQPNASSIDVPVMVQETDNGNAHIMSAAANMLRVPLHPVDQFRAYARMVADGASVSDIAIAFGVTERQVRQRMALGNVISPVMDAFTEERITMTVLEKFAIESKERQAEIWEEVEQHDYDNWQIVQLFENASYAPTDPIAQFVGRDSYINAGGRITADLFDDDDTEQWIDVALVKKLAEQQLDMTIKHVLQLGWAFVDTGAEGKHSLWEYKRVEPSYFWEDPKDEEEYARLKAIDDPDYDEEDALDQLAEKALELYTEEQRSQSGVFIDKSYKLHYGVIRPSSTKKTSEPEAAAEEEEGGLSAALTDDLNSLLTIAAQHELATSKIAVPLLAAQMVAMYEQRHGFGWPLAINNNQCFRKDDSPFKTHIEKEISKLKLAGLTMVECVAEMAKLSPAKMNALLGLLIAERMLKTRPDEMIVALLANNGDFIEGQLKFFEPFREEFFSRLTLPQIKEQLAKANIQFPGKELKKKELAAYAVRETKKAKWMPDELKAGEPYATGERAS